LVLGCGVAWMVPPCRWHLSYKLCLTINFLRMDLTNLAYLGPCFSKSLIFVCILKIIIVSKFITDFPAVLTVSFQHCLFIQKCTSASLDCPYKTIRTVQMTRPPVPTTPYKEPPIPAPRFKWESFFFFFV